MEMTERKKHILAAVIERYIKTGEPVGSKLLLESLDFSVSSATVRNEMAELSEMGYLEQPHTSSGRIPTQKGYRYYVDKLMCERALDEELKRRIDMMLGTHFGDPEKLLKEAAAILADITDCAVVTTTPTNAGATIRKVELVPVSKRTAIVVMLTSSGILKNKVCRTDTDITEEIVQIFYKMAAENFIGKPLQSMANIVLQSLVVSLGEYALSMSPIVIALSDLAQDAMRADIVLGGQQNLFNHSEISSDVFGIMEFLSKRDTLLNVLSGTNNGLNVYIGKENPFTPLQYSSMIVSPYTVSDSLGGAFGIIGPTRMDYATLVPSVKYFTKLVGEIISAERDE